MTSISNTDNSVYVQRSRTEAETAFVLATVASGAIMATLPYFSKPFLNQIKNEGVNNDKYKDAFIKAFNKSGLEEKGVTIQHTYFNNSDKAKLGTQYENQIINKEIKSGLNACYIPSTKNIKLNLDKAAISGFHEAGHAANHLQSKIGKLLQLFRKPGYFIAGLMGTVALFSRKKPKESDNNLMDKVQNNCGKIAFAAMLPTVAEEALASYKGIKLAQDGGLEKALVKNLKKFYGKALLSYVGYAAATGLSVFAAGKITEIFTRPKKVEQPQSWYY